ncbi:unnamed protein product, partial [Pylaiella littoralis]
ERGEVAVRQLKQELEKVSTLISDEATRKAQRLVQRLAAAKHLNAATNIPIVNEQLTAVSVELAKGERRGKGEPSAANRGATASQIGRRPWRVGAPPTGWIESRREPCELRRFGATCQVTKAVGETTDIIRDFARAEAERMVRRACLNLVNRPWRLAGVRLSIDPPSSSSKRRRAREARGNKEDQMAALVRGVTAAAREGIGRSGAGRFGWEGYGDERRHRNIRPRTSHEDIRGLCSRRPSPPSFPPRRRATSASDPSAGAAWQSNCDEIGPFSL